MGADKAFVVVDGRPMAVIVADALWEGGCNPVECQGGDVDRLGSELGLVAAPDPVDDRGPVAGIVAALERHRRPVLTVACDLPRLDAPTVRAVIEAGRRAESVAVARADGHDHLVAYWPPDAEATLAGLIATSSDHDPSLRAALDACAAIRVDVEPSAVRNVNRPDDIGSSGC